MVKFEHHAFPLDLAALNAKLLLDVMLITIKGFSYWKKYMKNKKYGGWI